MAPMRDSGAQSQVSLYITTGPPHGYIGPPRGPSCTLYRAKSRLAIFPFNENGGPHTAPLGGQQTQNHCQGTFGVPLDHQTGGKSNLNFWPKKIVWLFYPADVKHFTFLLITIGYVSEEYLRMRTLRLHTVYYNVELIFFFIFDSCSSSEVLVLLQRHLIHDKKIF